MLSLIIVVILTTVPHEEGDVGLQFIWFWFTEQTHHKSPGAKSRYTELNYILICRIMSSDSASKLLDVGRKIVQIQPKA